ncbi:MAG: BON domain-containing protein [Proteobacteria bacterium]|nr:BON domain-containing protein [Pseudomonadota bacterium]
MPIRPPDSYDELVARTLIDPDGSRRPTPQQLRDTALGLRAMDVDERALTTKVDDALRAAGLGGIEIEVEHRRVLLRGVVPDLETLNAITDTVGRIEGIETIDNRLHV